VLNWLSAAALLGTPVSDAETLFARSEAAAGERFAISRKFFEAVAIPDAALVRALGSGALARGAESAREVERLARLYQDTITQTLPSNREIESALAQIEIMETLVEKLGGRDGTAQSTASALRMLRQTIAGEPQASSAKGERTRAGAGSAETAKPRAQKTQASKTTPVKESKPAKPKAARRTRKKRPSNS
jgi:hypothetical protein